MPLEYPEAPTRKLSFLSWIQQTPTPMTEYDRCETCDPSKLSRGGKATARHLVPQQCLCGPPGEDCFLVLCHRAESFKANPHCGCVSVNLPKSCYGLTKLLLDATATSKSGEWVCTTSMISSLWPSRCLVGLRSSVLKNAKLCSLVTAIRDPTLCLAERELFAESSAWAVSWEDYNNA